MLRVRQSEATKRLASLVIDEEKEKRVVSVKRSKTKQKKKGAKVDPRMPKKPPTAFFYFLYVTSFFHLYVSECSCRTCFTLTLVIILRSDSVLVFIRS